ncbi:MAG: hypothetical protein AAB527_00915 [Patescibacteria group bacterium]
MSRRELDKLLSMKFSALFLAASAVFGWLFCANMMQPVPDHAISQGSFTGMVASLLATAFFVINMLRLMFRMRGVKITS